MTATPATAVRPETMKARPVRLAVMCIASSGSARRPRSSTNRRRMREVNSVQTAITSGPETAVSGLSFRRQRPGDQGHRPHGHHHRHQRQQRADDAAEPHGQEDPDEDEGQVGEQGCATWPGCRSRPDADHRDPARGVGDAGRRVQVVLHVARPPARAPPAWRSSTANTMLRRRPAVGHRRVLDVLGGDARRPGPRRPAGDGRGPGRRR